MRQKRRRSMSAAMVVLLLIAAFCMEARQAVKAGSEAAEVTAQQYIRQGLPSVSRGAERLKKDKKTGEEIKEIQKEQQKEKEEEDFCVLTVAKALTELSLPMVGNRSASLDSLQNPKKEDEPELMKEAQETEKTTETTETVAGEAKEQQSKEQAQTSEASSVTDSIKSPTVLIYHTHTTESYQPVSEGNFHSLAKEGTVRQVGEVLAQRLKELGYQVIHDETIHDNPSYNKSYSHSLETAKKYMSQYPNLALVIDLHRDAAGYSGGIAKTVSVDGKNAAAYGYVIGQGNPNVARLTETVNHLNRTAEKLYPGFTGRIIEKAYKFNQYISDYCVLIEVGNNENTIEQAKLTGRYLADVIAAYLKERGI